MAQPILEYITIEVSRKAGDQVSVANADGVEFTSQQRINAINGARQIIYDDKLSTLGVDEFAKTYKEFVKESSAITLATTSYLGNYPEYLRKIIGLKVKEVIDASTFGDFIEVKGLLPKAYYESEINDYSPFSPNINFPRWREFNKQFQVLGLTAASYLAYLIYLIDIVPVTLGGSSNDLSDPFSWQNRTINLAFNILLSDIQRKAE